MDEVNEPMIPLRLLPPARCRRGVISVTVPSRGRAAKLTKSIDSLRDTAKHPELVETRSPTTLMTWTPSRWRSSACRRDLEAPNGTGTPGPRITGGAGVPHHRRVGAAHVV